MHRTKKYQLNFNMAPYNYKTGLYENNDRKFLSYKEASRNKWKCEKCFQAFQNYKMLSEHKSQFHSY